MRRTIAVLAVVGLFGAVAVGSAALANTGGVTLCAAPGGNVTWPGEDGECKRNETPLPLGSAAALTALQTEVDDLDSRVTALENLLTGVRRGSFNDLRFPGGVHAFGNVTGDNVSALHNVQAGFDVTAHNSVYADRDVVATHEVNARFVAADIVRAQYDVIAGWEVRADRDVIADYDRNTVGALYVGGTRVYP